MTMRSLVWAALATGFLVASANDTVRLGGPSAVQSAGDTELVHGRGHHGGGYSHGHYGGGYGRSYYGGGYGRGYYGGYYRPYFGVYYRPYVYGSYYSPYYISSNYTPYYSSSYYTPYYSSSYYDYPIAGETVSRPATTLQSSYQSPVPVQQQYVPPMPPASNGNGTFQYDGGPRSVIPMPAETNPASTPRSIIPTDGRLVSLPTQTTGGTSQISTRPTTTRAKTSEPRVSYPAYGE
jgi:hypothetical protein